MTTPDHRGGAGRVLGRQFDGVPPAVLALFDEIDDLRSRIASETVRAEMAENRLAAVEAVRDHYAVLAGLPVNASDVADRLDAALGGAE